MSARISFRLLAVLVVAALFAVVIPTSGAHATTFARLGGDGSSWAAPAIDQWSNDVRNQGIQVDYNPDGSAAGRQNYVVDQADFAGSDIQFLTQGDPFGGGIETSSLAYSYVPIVAGGTAFMYNLVVGGRKITDLRLRGETIAKIFTGVITNWDDPQITADYGAALPSQPITVVTRSDGSGASYQFSRYLSKSFPSIWNAFCAAHHGPNPCGPTEFFPTPPNGQGKQGSDQAAAYVASPTYGPGSIAYDEYAYALNNGLPVVKLLNAAGYFTLPTASNVAVALQAAIINSDINSVDFLIQDLDDVYGDNDPRAYPVSSYSYLIVPRVSRPGTSGPPTNFTTDKGATLSTWLNYVLCGAQKTAGQLGYSPLPKNLVVGGFQQVLQIPGQVGVPDLDKLTGCDNPTYSDGVNHLVVDAPQPSPCDKLGSPLNCVVQNGQATAAGSQVAGSGNDSHTGRTAPTGGGNAGSGGGGGTTAAGASGGSTAAVGAGGVDPLSGEVTGSGTGDGDTVYAAPVAVSGAAGGNAVFSVLAAIALVAAVAAPAAVGSWLQRSRRKQAG